MWIGSADEGSSPGLGWLGSSSPAFRSSGIAGGPARGLARGGSGKDATLAAMAAVGMWLGSADEGSLRLAGSPPRALPGAARLSAESQGAWVAFSAPDDIVLILSLHPLK